MNKLAEVYSQKTLPEWIAKTEDLNKLMSQDSVDAAVKMSEQQRILRADLESVRLEVGEKLLPKWNDLLTALDKFWQTSGPAVVETVGKIADGIGSVIDTITRLIDTLNRSGLGGLLGLNGNNQQGGNIAPAWITGPNQAGLELRRRIEESAGAVGGGIPVGQAINNIFNLQANYAYQDRQSLADDIRALSMLFGGSNR